MARENQGLQIALIIFVMLTIVLGVTTFIFFLIGGLLAMIIRGELITPAADLVDRTVYNGIYTMHGTIMLFLFIFPVLNGLNNLLIPTMIGAFAYDFYKNRAEMTVDHIGVIAIGAGRHAALVHLGLELEPPRRLVPDADVAAGRRAAA